jgi:prohibitin 2
MQRPDFQKLAGAATSGMAPVAALGAVGLFGAAYFANNLMFNVEAGHRAVKFNRLSGIQNQVYAEGTHFNIPWFEWPIFFDIKTRPRNISSNSGTKDLQMVNISVRTLSRPHPDKIADIYRTLGHDYDEVVLLSIANEVLKSVVARFSAQEMITQRGVISALIKKELSERAIKFHILLDDVAITHLTFSPDFEKAVESKQVAQQQADRAKFLVVKADEEKKATIIRAEASAAEAELIGAAMKENPGFAELRRIQQAQSIAKVLANSSNKVVLSAESLMLNLMGDNAVNQFGKGK